MSHTALPDSRRSSSGGGRRCLGRCIRRLALVALVSVAVTATLAVEPTRAAAIAAPVLVSMPDDYTSDSTPTWTFTAKPGARLDCMLVRPPMGAWSGEEPPPTETIDRRTCDDGTYSIDLGAEIDYQYVFSVTQTDAAESTSEPASDWFVLDRVATPPVFYTGPDDVTNDPTPIWTYGVYEWTAPSLRCALTRAGAADPVYDGECGSTATFTFDLNPYPDGRYTLALTLTDLAGNTADPVTDSFVLDRTVPNAAPSAAFVVDCNAYWSCRFDAHGSADSDGRIASYRFDFGDGQFVINSGSFPEAWHVYRAAAASYTVTLTVTDNAEATATATRTVTFGDQPPAPPPPPPPNAPPSAAFGVSCSGQSCSVDAGGSTDDATITSYRWEFGDGSTATGKVAQHTFGRVAGYTIELTVTDNDGATATATRTVGLISLAAKPSKPKGRQVVELSWSGPAGASVEVRRDGQRITDTSASTYTDNLNRKGSGTYRYQVCHTGSAICSNTATVSF